MSEPIEFKLLKFPETEKLVSDFEHVTVEGDTRIYYELVKKGEKYGFNFYATVFHSSYADDGEDEYLSDGFKAECLFWGRVTWDGLRHLYMGDKQTDTENYLYYASTVLLSKVFLKLRELEEKYCDVTQLEI